MVPSELQDYLNTIQKQRLKFEEELEECDALMDRTISSAKGEGNTGQWGRCVMCEWSRSVTQVYVLNGGQWHICIHVYYMLNGAGQ